MRLARAAHVRPDTGAGRGELPRLRPLASKTDEALALRQAAVDLEVASTLARVVRADDEHDFAGRRARHRSLAHLVDDRAARARGAAARSTATARNEDEHGEDGEAASHLRPAHVHALQRGAAQGGDPVGAATRSNVRNLHARTVPSDEQPSDEHRRVASTVGRSKRCYAERRLVHDVAR
jgi:hypothetical protein